eukprot:g65519.t1
MAVIARLDYDGCKTLDSRRRLTNPKYKIDLSAMNYFDFLFLDLYKHGTYPDVLSYFQSRVGLDSCKPRRATAMAKTGR